VNKFQLSIHNLAI